MHSDPTPGIAWLAALAPQPRFLDSLIFQLNGLVVVFLALGTIWGMMEIVGLLFRRRAPAVPVAPAAALAATGAALPADGFDGRTLALITAAVHVTLGRGYRVRAISTGDVRVEWAQEGRRQIFASHKLR
jgi:Na+-transporting methylmalonyl-CoA/oxaloacetate decarboxylase gamma subunit